MHPTLALQLMLDVKCVFFLQVLYEAMADKQTRKSRAQALQVLGRLFQQAALAATAGVPQVRSSTGLSCTSLPLCSASCKSTDACIKMI